MDAQPTAPPEAAAKADRYLRIRLLSYNIQVALETRHAGHYLTGAWRHVLPSTVAHANLDRIADIIRGYDFVAIQEGDAGSLRTRYRNQIEYLADKAGYPYYNLTITRDLHPFARHCLGFLSRYQPEAVDDLQLPSPIPGRRALRVRLGAEAGGLVLIVTHLSLGRRSQERQLEFLAAQIDPQTPAVLVGDLNCELEHLRGHSGLQRCGWTGAEISPLTFPSWRPRRGIDHVLVTGNVQLKRLETLPFAISDHLPLAADIDVPLPDLA